MKNVIYFIVILLVFRAGLTLAKKKSTHDEDIRKTMSTISNQLEAFVSKMEKIENRVNAIEKQMTSASNADSTDTTSELQAISTKYQFSSFGCVSDVIHLGCNNGKKIFVYSANYGKISYLCSEGCCPPHPGRDCVESVEESRPQDWLALKVLCDNQTSCQYEYLGSVIDSCEPGYIADYMSIYYTCLPEDVDAPVGFTAFHNYNRVYGENEMVRFNATQLNSGGHFQTSSSTFICPWNGIYGFFFSTYNTVDDDIACYLNLEGTMVSGNWMASGANAILQASNMAIVNCTKGDRVYVETGINGGTIHGDNDRTSFSGFSINRFG